MSQAHLEQFRRRVLEDPALQKVLREMPDPEAFLALLVWLGEEQGYRRRPI